MSSKEIIAKIKAEIERLKKEELTRNSIGVITGSAFFVHANELLSFLSTLEKSEKPNGPTIEEPIDGILYAAACGIKNATEKSEERL